ncbi:hypothetical protein SAY86_005145 [Trapa natans]|uniref:DUF1421 domain-containing protein n=1 Tax=Trapa natans TaxID=22666 RepID=A0AAN7KZH8_TRANT|nr:hypothetical protein SAY86_005145 [Trapa natans]
MASGYSGRANSGPGGVLDLATYEDFGNRDSSNGSNSDPLMGTNSRKDFHKSRFATPVYAAPPPYSQPEDSLNEDVVIIVERSMKKHVDNLMLFLEGISSRLSQLELYCYNLDRSMGEMRSEFNRDHDDADTKLKSLDKHLQEVHRSVQILRDKQELAETQKELAKLQLVQKETSLGNSQSSEERASAPAPETKKTDNPADASNQQLALALPHQVAPPQPVSPPSQTPAQSLPQLQAYYLSRPQMPTPSGAAHVQYGLPDPQGRSTQLQENSQMPPPSMQPQVNQQPTMHPFPQYQQQQWHQQVPSQMRAPPTPVYSSYLPNQPSNSPLPLPPQEYVPNSMHMQLPYAGGLPPVPGHAETVPYGYGGPSRILQQQQPPAQPVKGAFRPPPSGDGYAAAPQNPIPPCSGYMVYESDSVRTPHQHPPQQGHFSQGMYPPPNVPPHPNPSTNSSNNLLVSHPQFARSHPHGELIDKLMRMGFRGDHVASVIQRMEETGQPVDFNFVLDQLKVHSSVGSQMRWSG